MLIFSRKKVRCRYKNTATMNLGNFNFLLFPPRPPPLEEKSGILVETLTGVVSVPKPSQRFFGIESNLS